MAAELTPDHNDERQLLASYRTHLSTNYAEFLERLGLDHRADHATGATIRDSRGRTYVDLIAGYGVFNFGHNPPTLLEALREELTATPARSGPFLSAPLATLAERLSGLTRDALSKVFVCSTGAEAVDSAIKLARLSTRRPGIVAAQGGFHGFTLGALSVSGVPAQTLPYAPLLPQVRHVPFGDADALAAAVSRETAAVLLEPIQAEIGAETPPDGYLAAARAICDEAGALLIIDEVRTGMGRTGPMFAMEHDSVMPDILVIGKSLAGGIVPIGAMLAHPRLWTRFGLTFSMSASSFAGNRLASVAALTTLSTLATPSVLESAREMGALLRRGLDALSERYPNPPIRISGRGLLLGVHFATPRLASEVVRMAIERGVLVATAFCNSRCVLLEPPLVIERSAIEHALGVLDDAVRAASATPRRALG